MSQPLQHESVSAAAEASIRQLIANGKDKVALDRAKEIHKAQRSAASEALLVEAYAARIQALTRQGLVVEAKSLLDLARERYPASQARLDRLIAPAMAKAGDIEQLVQPLSDPATGSELRASIEKAVQQDIWDLGALAECAALPSDDPLRLAASALHRALLAVTNGPVDEASLALPEVSRRSPLAPWKMLVRAIACFYRREDEACRQYLDAVQADSAPARLVPAIHAMLGDKTRAPLTAASAALVSRIMENSSALRNALDALDRSFAADEKGRILQAIRAAVHECRLSAPDLVSRLTQHITVRSATAALNPNKLVTAMGGEVRGDASFLRLLARGMEESRDMQGLASACAAWNEFRKEAVKEGWFAENGAEAAAIYLHIAELLRKMPRELVQELQRNARQENMDAVFLHPDILYQRACVHDPHSEAFSQWLDWAKGEKGGKPQKVAEAWHKVFPQDIAPILYLMTATEKRGAFPTALKYVAKAEQIDSVHPEVRKARLRLMAGNAVRQIQQKKFDAASRELAEMAALPQSQQGDRAAFLAALRYTVSAVRGDDDRAAAHRAEIERVLSDRVAAGMLVSAVAAASKAAVPESFGPVEKLAAADRLAFPAAFARVSELAEDMRMTLNIPPAWVAETRRQLASDCSGLDTSQLRSLAEAALRAKSPELAYNASAAGLERGGATEARFLLLRARSLPQRLSDRSEVCAAAAAELARQQRDTELVAEAVELLHESLESDGITLTLDQAVEVLKKEKAEPYFPAGFIPGPDYSGIVGEELCQCPDCRRARAEIDDPDTDFDVDEEDLLQDLPPDMPAEIARMLLEETKRAVLNGESMESLMARLMGGRLTGKSKRGRRR